MNFSKLNYSRWKKNHLNRCAIQAALCNFRKFILAAPFGVEQNALAAISIENSIKKIITQQTPRYIEEEVLAKYLQSNQMKRCDSFKWTAINLPRNVIWMNSVCSKGNDTSTWTRSKYLHKPMLRCIQIDCIAANFLYLIHNLNIASSSRLLTLTE